VFITLCQRKKALPSSIFLGCICWISASSCYAGHYTTKTPYQAQQDFNSYEVIPAGFEIFHTQLVARHGARGLSKMKADLALFNLWKAARQQNALTPLGENLGPQLEKLIEVNALLGYGVLSGSPPGYGNLSQQGVQEHAQLAQRMLVRLPSLFVQLENDKISPDQKSIRVLHSGVNRAKDSADSFVNALVTQKPKLKAQLHYPILKGYPEANPKDQLPGVNRFLLYFHSLNDRTDAALNMADPNAKIFKYSQAYQNYSNSPRITAKARLIHESEVMHSTANQVLSRLFKSDFLERLKSGKFQVANTGKFHFKSKDGVYQVQLEGDGRAQIRTPLDALLALSDAYEIAPGLQHELGFNFNEYISDSEAKILAEANDAEDFYSRGPGIAEDPPLNSDMAEGLLLDFFDQINQANSSPIGKGATLRFTHAEVMVSFAGILQIPKLTQALPFTENYSYANSAWRGALIAPYSANVQWDTFRNPQGSLVVRMLYNERETHFKSTCDSARMNPQSFYYKYEGLKACYGVD
jgi:hypothetical protein